MNNSARFIGQAIKAAHLSKYKYRLGAVAVKDNKVMATGHNQLKTHPRIKGYLHAETSAIIKTESCDTVVVVRISKRGLLRMAKPCDGCIRFMKANGVKNIIYTDWAGNLQEMTL